MKIGCVSAFVFSASLAIADISLPSFIGSGMVLQRESEVAVFGKADAGEKITVAFAGQSLSAVTDSDGNWRVTLAPMSATKEPGELTVSSDSASVTCSDVLVGDVWLVIGPSVISGQFRKSREPDAAELAKSAADYPLLRIAAVEHARADFPAPRLAYDESFLSGTHRWTAHLSGLARASVLPYAFARQFVESAPDVPVGLIVVPGGSSGTDGFISADVLRATPGLEAYSEKVDAMLPQTELGKRKFDEFVAAYETWFKTTSAELAEGKEPTLGAAPVYPHLRDGEWCGEFNAMIVPLRGLAARGVMAISGVPPEGRDRETTRYDQRADAFRRSVESVFGNGVKVRFATLGKSGMVAQGRSFAKEVLQ